MKRLLLVLPLLLLSGCLEKNPDISIAEVYAFATAGKNGAVFATIENVGGADRLTGAASDIAERVEIHENAMKDGVMSMRQIDALDIPAKGQAVLEPKGHHIMLLDLKEPLVEGQTFDLTLTFAQSGDMTFPVPIGAPGQKPVEEDHDHEHTEDDGHDHHH